MAIAPRCACCAVCAVASIIPAAAANFAVVCFANPQKGAEALIVYIQEMRMLRLTRSNRITAAAIKKRYTEVPYMTTMQNTTSAQCILIPSPQKLRYSVHHLLIWSANDSQQHVF